MIYNERYPLSKTQFERYLTRFLNEVQPSKVRSLNNGNPFIIYFVRTKCFTIDQLQQIEERITQRFLSTQIIATHVE